VTTLSVATTEYTKGDDGNRKEMTEWHRAVVWGTNAENCNKYLVKGSQVAVEGRLQTRQWEKDGEKRYSTEIVAQRVEFLSAAGGKKSEEPRREEPPKEPSLDDIPF
jgi:single-strand DNA-binding protein